MAGESFKAWMSATRDTNFLEAAFHCSFPACGPITIPKVHAGELDTNTRKMSPHSDGGVPLIGQQGGKNTNTFGRFRNQPEEFTKLAKEGKQHSKDGQLANDWRSSPSSN